VALGKAVDLQVVVRMPVGGGSPNAIMVAVGMPSGWQLGCHQGGIRMDLAQVIAVSFLVLWPLAPDGAHTH